jgi:hypothetical protein
VNVDLPCDLCGVSFKVGDHVQLTCIGFDTAGEAILSSVHTACLDASDRQN